MSGFIAKKLEFQEGKCPDKRGDYGLCRYGNVVYMFGGRDFDTIYYNDLWKFDSMYVICY